MRLASWLPAALVACSPPEDLGIQHLAIDLVPALPAAWPPGLDALDAEALSAASARVEVAPVYRDGDLHAEGLPDPPEGVSFYAVFGFADAPRADLIADADPLAPEDFPWDAAIGPLYREEDGHTGLVFFEAQLAPYDLAALRTALVIAAPEGPVAPASAAVVLAGAFVFSATGEATEGHSHGP